MPFTSLDGTITFATDVLQEGGYALGSAFSAYSYHTLYSQVESCLQEINVHLAITFTKWCWVFLDSVWPITMAFGLPLAKAKNKLTLPLVPQLCCLGLS